MLFYASKSPGLVIVSCCDKNIILRRFGYFDKKLVFTPYDTNIHLKKNLEHNVDKLRFAQIIGSLIYLMHNISLTLHVL